jgi:hypothetical protein
MKNFSTVLAVLFGAVLLYAGPSSCQNRQAIYRLAIEQAEALDRGDITTARSINESIQSLADSEYEPPTDTQ